MVLLTGSFFLGISVGSVERPSNASGDLVNDDVELFDGVHDGERVHVLIRKLLALGLRFEVIDDYIFCRRSIQDGPVISEVYVWTTFRVSRSGRAWNLVAPMLDVPKPTLDALDHLIDSKD